MKFSHLLLLVIAKIIPGYCAVAQLQPSIPVSYQEVTTKILSQTLDEAGNTYTGGIFKGALIVKQDTLAFGKGGEDYFVIKENAAGETIWVLPFGSPLNEAAFMKLMYNQGHIYISCLLNENFKIQNQQIDLLQHQAQQACLIQLDSSGQFNWAKRTNTPALQLYPFNNGVLARMTMAKTLPITIESDTAVKENNFNTQVFVRFKESGEFIVNSTVYSEHNTNANISVITRIDRHRNRIYFLFLQNASGPITGTNALMVNGQRVNFASNTANLMFIKTDTMFNMIQSKTVNQNGETLITGAFDESRLRFSEDSLRLHLYLNNVIYRMDALNEDLRNKHAIIELDANFLTQSIKTINTNLPIDGRQPIQVNFVQQAQGKFFILGNVSGRNQNATMLSILEDQKPVEYVNGYTNNHNFNGPTKSFLIKCNQNLQFEEIVWVTDQSFYETGQVGFEDFSIVQNHIKFFNNNDNVWNPWNFTLTLQKISGENKYNADLADYVERVVFFPNKTKAVLGLSNGFNLFDGELSIVPRSMRRRDFFYAIMDSSGKVIQYNRLFSSYNTPVIRDVRLNGDSLFVLVRLNQSNNQSNSNFIKLGSFERLLTGNAQSILIGLDTLGNFSIRDFNNTPIGSINNFDIYPNGDFAVSSQSNTISLNLNGQTFPNRNGIYFARFQKNGNLLQAMKCYPRFNPTLFQVNSLQIEKTTGDLVTDFILTVPANTHTLEMITARNGSQESSNLIPITNSTGQRTYNVIQRNSFTENTFTQAIGPFTQLSGGLAVMTTQEQTTYVAFQTQSSSEEVRLSNQVLLQAASQHQSMVFSLDINGNLLKSTIFEKAKLTNTASFSARNIKTINNNLYLIGQQTDALKFGALNISHKGEFDGLIIKMDTNLNLSQFYSVSTEYQDFCTDLDVYLDSSICIAFRSQGNPIPKIGLNQTGLGFINPSDLEEAGWLSTTFASAIPRDFIYTIKQGDWHDATIWNNGKVPINLDRVIIRHKVQINQPADCFQLLLDPNADLKANDGARLNIWGAKLNE